MFGACQAFPLLAQCVSAWLCLYIGGGTTIKYRSGRGLIPNRYAGFYQHEIIHEKQLVSTEFDQPHFNGDSLRRVRIYAHGTF